MEKRDYLIRQGSLKGMKVSEAYSKGLLLELIEFREFLLKSFEENENYREKILSGILSIDSYLLPQYSKLLNEFTEKLNKLPIEKQKSITKSLDVDSLQKNNIVYLKKLLEELN